MNTLIVLSLGLLIARYDAQPGDPVHMHSDLENVQTYLAQHPETRELLDTVAQYKWTLRYRKRTLATQFKGTRLTLTRAVIYFDPRTGARLAGRRGGVLSPAQALVHELLHVKEALGDPKTFLHQSLPGLYPVMHERSVIQAEQRLFRRMGIHTYRSRDNHKGKYVVVSCVTCLK